MGLFSRKSPEEKRVNKFNKKIKLAEKTTRSWNCPIGELYMLSSNEDEYKKTGEYFKQWTSKYFAFIFEEKKHKYGLKMLGVTLLLIILTDYLH